MTFKDKPRRPKAGADSRGARDARKPGGAAEKRSPKPAFKSDAKADPKKSGKPFSKAASSTPATETTSEAVKPERISKLLARAGVASRRDVERMIMEGRVVLNGKVLDTPVVNATFADQIEVDGVPVRGIERTRLWLYHKPAGLVTTNADPEGRPTVFDNLPDDLPRVMSIGRLDINTEGLLLLTNDGGLARVLELPTTGWLRRYRVRAHGDIDQPALDALKEGIAVDGVLYGGIDATLDRKQGHNVWISMGLREGKNREVKNVLGALGLEVNRLIRISYGPFQLGDLGEGKVVEVRGRMLRDQLGPRLIEEAKANFDAPVFSPAAADEDDGAKPAKVEKPRQKKRDFREEGLERLDTRKAAAGKPGGGKGKFAGASRRTERDGDFVDRPKRQGAAQGRTSNVWMAPGARPVAAKAAGADDGEKRGSSPRREGAPQSNRYGRDNKGKPTRAKTKFDPDRRDAYAPKREDALRVTVSRARDEEGEWIRAESPPGRPRDGDKGFGGKRAFGDRPPRRDSGDRPERADRPAYARKDRFQDDGPRGGKPFSDKPKGGKSFAGKSGGKSFGGKPGGKPAGGRPGDGKGTGGKGFGGRPSSRPGPPKGKR